VFPDREDQPVRITVSGCIVTVTVGRQVEDSVPGLDGARVLEEAQLALRRAKARGGNTIETTELARPSLSVSEAASFLQCGTRKVRALISAGTLPSVEADGHARVDRLALEAYRKRTRNRAR
jgi:excisionase family DNA binding protein